jgi:hypothetical protein
MFNTSEKLELKPVAAYINGLPPREEWVEIRSKLQPGIALEIECLWKWVGISLDAFFSNLSDPVPHSGLNEIMRCEVQSTSSEFLSLSILIFRAEHLIKKEAKEAGITWMDNLSRSDILKGLAWEQCQVRIWLARQDYWESHNRLQSCERSQELKKYLKGENTEVKMEILKKRWEKEDARAIRPNPPEDLLCLTEFCLRTFEKYRKELPEFTQYIDLLQKQKIDKKFVINKGKFEYVRSRGKGKKQKSS